MKTVIHYFSATGNTARAVRIVAARLEAAGHLVDTRTIDGPAPPAGEIPDLTVLAFPIWAWAAPHFVLDHARRLPQAHGARAAILATCGGFGAQALGEMERALRRRGYAVETTGEAVYPDNWVLAANPKTGTALDDALAKGDDQAARFASDLLRPEPSRYACPWTRRLWSRPIALLFRWTGRRFMGKFFIADGACASCGACAAACPVKAIRMAGSPPRPIWNAHCAGCYRCINLCPARAIQVSSARMALHLGLNLALAATAIAAAALLLRRSPLPPGPGLAATAIAAAAGFAALTALQLTAADALLRRLSSLPALRRFFERGHTRSFGRYRAPGFHPK